MDDIERLLLKLSVDLSDQFTVDCAREVRRRLDVVRGAVPLPPPDTIEQSPIRNLFDYVELKSHDAVLGRTQWLQGELAEIDREARSTLVEAQRENLTVDDIRRIDTHVWELRDRIDAFESMDEGAWPLRCLLAYIDAQIRRSLNKH